MDPRRRELTLAQIERLKAQRARLERDWARIPRLAWALLFVVPAYFLWGITGALSTVLFVPCLIGTAAYLVGVRRFENGQTIAELEQAVAKYDAEVAAAGAAPSSASN